jgi:hypothetical protein
LPLTRGRALAYATPHSLWTPVKRTCKPCAPCYQGNGAGGAMLNVRACSGRPALARRACHGWQPQGMVRGMKRRRTVKDDVQRSRRGVPGGSPPVFGSPTSGFPRQAGILKCRKEVSMQYLRLYTGPDGASHFEDVPVAMSPVEFIPKDGPGRPLRPASCHRRRLRESRHRLGRRHASHAAAPTHRSPGGGTGNRRQRWRGTTGAPWHGCPVRGHDRPQAYDAQRGTHALLRRGFRWHRCIPGGALHKKCSLTMLFAPKKGLFGLKKPPK